MPYYFDPWQYAYVYYPEGSKPPTPQNKGEEFVPGFTESYTKSFPNQPYSQMTRGSSNSSVVSTIGSPASSGGTGTGGAAGGGNPNDDRNAYEFLKRTFEGWGLGSLAPKILEFVQQGYDADTIMLMIQDTSEYKQRFAGNDKRRAAGLPVLAPSEYLALERQYRQLLSTAGLPKGFYDSYDDFTGWISGDVSPAEIQERVTLASNAIYSSDNHYLQTLRSYGLGDGDLVAYMLDTKKALPLLQKQVRAAQVGAEASRNSLGIDKARAEYFADLGVSGEQARGAYQMIAENLPAAGKLGALYGESFGQGDLEDELMGGSGLASAKRKRLTAKEASQFAGRSGVGDKALAGKSRGEY